MIDDTKFVRDGPALENHQQHRVVHDGTTTEVAKVDRK